MSCKYHYRAAFYFNEGFALVQRWAQPLSISATLSQLV